MEKCNIWIIAWKHIDRGKVSPKVWNLERDSNTYCETVVYCIYSHLNEWTWVHTYRKLCTVLNSYNPEPKHTCMYIFISDQSASFVAMLITNLTDLCSKNLLFFFGDISFHLYSAQILLHCTHTAILYKPFYSTLAQKCTMQSPRIP